MRRHLVLLACVPALSLPPAAGTAAAAGPASVKLVDCAQAAVPAARSATFEARARAVGASARIQVRFTLQVRADGEGGGWRRVVAPALEEWLGSAAGVRRYSYARTVRNLTAPATYRTVVRFRWLDENGKAVKSARAVSPVCRQPDVRPDLTATSVDVQAGPDPATRRYAVAVRNDGRTAAGPFTVAVRAGDHALDPPALLVGLAAGETRTVSVTGPACVPGEPLNVTVDAEDAVDERGEENNHLAAVCPPPPPVTSSRGPARSGA